MSRFYAEIQGSAGPASRQGSEKSGIWGHVRGWDHGARVECFLDGEGHDITVVSVTGGSGYGGTGTGPLVRVTQDGKGRRIVRVYHPETGRCVGAHRLDD